MTNAKIFIADDDAEILDLLIYTLESEHYTVVTASDGDTALRKIVEEKPDLIILDVNMPGMSGFEVCQKVRENSDICLTPVIILSSLAKTKDRITGIKLGADEYLTKPFEPFELAARVEGLLKRARESLAASPLTGLPGNVSIETEIKNRLAGAEEFCVIYSDLDHFKSYNDRYGFDRGDAVIKLVSTIFRTAVAEEGNSKDFIGHIGGDDFVVVTTPDKCRGIAQKIAAVFGALIINQYDTDARKNGFVSGKDRAGAPAQFPIMTISTGCAKVVPGKFPHYSLVVEKARELLKTAKTQTGNSLVCE
ncbi:MAG: diguanylate cyclase response regulator [Elusimicrobia bacterium HGW-Elusimicrobia-1]|jgi:diguanylate cyclase (GGDEF)-like protein|nr:MAG: diguanylate cyclase response regulator [Elusimicrobia bacterium HGW-Elusimicrobia-1]